MRSWNEAARYYNFNKMFDKGLYWDCVRVCVNLSRRFIQPYLPFPNAQNKTILAVSVETIYFIFCDVYICNTLVKERSLSVFTQLNAYSWLFYGKEILSQHKSHRHTTRSSKHMLSNVSGRGKMLDHSRQTKLYVKLQSTKLGNEMFLRQENEDVFHMMKMTSN